MPLDVVPAQCVATPEPAVGDLGCYSIRWACVYTHPQAERWAKTNLQLVGYRVWFPTRTIQQRDRSITTKVEPVTRPLFPRYGFIAFDHRDTSWSPIRNTPGVIDLVRCGALPAYTNAEAVVRLQAVQELAATQPPETSYWHLGDAVAPRIGPFQGLPGVVLAVREENAVVGILFLGQLREVVYPFDAIISRNDF
jgi:transcription antitermination factor NusG